MGDKGPVLFTTANIPVESYRGVCLPEDIFSEEYPLTWRVLVDEEELHVGIAYQRKGYDHEPHFHQTPEMFICLEGSAKTYLDCDNCTDLNVGQSLYAASNVVHRTVATEFLTVLYIFNRGPFSGIKYHYPWRGDTTEPSRQYPLIYNENSNFANEDFVGGVLRMEKSSSLKIDSAQFYYILKGSCKFRFIANPNICTDIVATSSEAIFLKPGSSCKVELSSTGQTDETLIFFVSSKINNIYTTINTGINN